MNPHLQRALADALVADRLTSIGPQERPRRGRRSSPLAPRSRAWLVAVATVTLLAVAGTGAALAHGGGLLGASAGAAGESLRLRGCFMTVGLVPRPLSAVELALRRPLDASHTFYGSEPLAGVWALRCERTTAGSVRLRDVVVSLVAAPRGLTSAGAPPLANFFDHALLRADTDSRRLARLLAAYGVPAGFVRGMRYRHRSTASHSKGRLEVPGHYRMAVRAGLVDPTNPHDHRNRFAYRSAAGATGAIDLRANGAADRFCLAALGDCSIAVAGHSQALEELLGDGSVAARAGFDHERIARIDLTLRG